MFMGEYAHTIDAKGRLIIPAKFREGLGESCVVTKGFDGCLTVFTVEGFQKLANSLNNLASSKASVRTIKRFFFGSATDLGFDKQGRVLIPSVLRAHAKLKKETVIVGANDRVEIWGREEWDAYNESVADEIENLAESLDDSIVF